VIPGANNKMKKFLNLPVKTIYSPVKKGGLAQLDGASGSKDLFKWMYF
jgi:hypothetical protein